MSFDLRPYQRAAIDCLHNHMRMHDDNPAVVLPTGCHAKGTLILMRDGTTKAVEDIAVGDALMGPDSKPRRVLRLIRGTEMLYRIIPKKGEPFVVNQNHMLCLRTTNEGKPHACATTGKELDCLTVDAWLDKSKSWRNLRKLWRTGVDFPAYARPDFCPWALGVLLGDDSLKNGVQFSKLGADVFDAMQAEMRRHGLDYWAHERCGEWYRLPRAADITALFRQLLIFGLGSGDKFIPDGYKFGSRKDRLDLLAGLLDTGGHHDGRGGYDFISKSKRLAEDLTFVARSLGLAAYCKPSEKYCQTGAGGTYWRVHISGDTYPIPMRCKRKQAPLRRQKKNPLVTGFDVEPVGRGEFFGFTLDGDHLYLTADFTVHHNSGKTVVMAELILASLIHCPACKFEFPRTLAKHDRTASIPTPRWRGRAAFSKQGAEP